MIAIAGAKGGCGKTVTTLGLTEAFAREGTPAIAIDADRQLPNLHVAGGVDREPTLAMISTDAGRSDRTGDAGGVDLRSIAQVSPRTTSAGIVPAPAPTDSLDLESVLEGLESETGQLLVDCPSGAGPDVVEPLSAADGVVVTTDGDRSLRAAKTTVAMARRLGVRVLGVVVNRCSSVPPAIESWVDVPVLGVVPEATSPLTDEATTSAYADVVETLRTRHATDRTAVAYDDDRLPTGIAPLDRHLGGGLVPGSVLAVTAEPASQSEHLVYEATAPRGTLYLTTDRSADNVRRALETTTVDTGTPTIRRVTGDDRLEDATAFIEKLPTGATLVVDVMGPLERHGREAYVSFLNDLKDRLVETESIALLHCLEGAVRPEHRIATIHAADAVVAVESAPSVRDSASGRELTIRKCRHERVSSAPIDLEGTDARSTLHESTSASTATRDAEAPDQ
ncbi:DUF7125 family protein [Natronorubrum daqingense]|uniref:Chromosome partitioning protein n=1 Tax=Natronorubrum daqingense TaxID=588898 RepID=A0A1N7FR52_9EURY|nr:P-loop NTPase [Natronorubrum daqingense]APX97347.1 chromosome partitioning protein [Natronorubrum daqingense]SIS02716.1 MinD-like ATPase involved in chromosome partitioning or flagellar assembly [Natronorubrum daqingense]